MNKMTLRDLKDEEIEGKKVFVRCDFNVPLKDAKITDNRRIVEALKTIKYLIDRKAKVILCSHLGRPKGQENPEFSLAPVAEELSRLLDQQEVKFASDIVGPSAKSLADSLKPGEVMLLQNVRYDAREEKNDPEFAGELAGFAEIYVNDAFGTAHRAHASTAGIVEHLPKNAPAVSGFLIEKELQYLGDALDDPKKPFVVILGGAKVSDKIGVIENLTQKADKIIIVGAMAYTFLIAKGLLENPPVRCQIGNSFFENDKLDFAKKMLQEAGDKIVLPTDTIVGLGVANVDEITPDTESKLVNIEEIPEGSMGLDIGPATESMISAEIEKAGTVFWNGPAGLFENKKFSHGTMTIAISMAKSKAITIIGGGDSAKVAKVPEIAENITHVSTGGGASLEYLEGKGLPGIDCLMEKKTKIDDKAKNDDNEMCL